jgi:hypothetical protein
LELGDTNAIRDLQVREEPDMSLYSMMLFIHVSAAICLFIGFGIWLFGITVIAHAACVEQVRTLADVLLMVRLVVPVSALLVIVAGLTMALTTWGLQTGWIAVALGGLVIVGPIATWVIDPRVRAMAALAHTLPDGPLPTQLAERTHDRVLRLALHTTTALLFGIVFLMTTKPVLTSALGAMVVSAFLGLVSGILLVRVRRATPPDHFQQHEEAS